MKQVKTREELEAVENGFADFLTGLHQQKQQEKGQIPPTPVSENAPDWEDEEHMALLEDDIDDADDAIDIEDFDEED